MVTRVGPMGLALTLSLVSFFGRSGAEESVEFSVCPKSHSWAFDSGRQCCTEHEESLDLHLEPVPSHGNPPKYTPFDRNTYVSPWKSDKCAGDTIACPEAPCESHFSPCMAVGPSGYTFIDLKGFPSTEINGQYTFFYGEGAYEANQPIYRNEDTNNCIWWHRQFRHWWVGSCENVGHNAGYAYIAPDLYCPHTMEEHVWRRGGSDEELLGTNVRMTAVLSAGGTATEDTSGTVGVNAIIRTGRYQQRCRFKLLGGKWRCV